VMYIFFEALDEGIPRVNYSSLPDGEERA